jgi:heme/copper-type cytochrome/quinol oxidase subunit 2
MGAGLAAAGRPLGATVEVRLQRHGARRVEEQCQNDTVQILFFFIFIIIIIIIIIIFFLFVGTQKWVTTLCRNFMRQ